MGCIWHCENVKIYSHTSHRVNVNQKKLKHCHYSMQKLAVIRSHFSVVVERALLGKCKKISAWSALLSRIKATFGKMSVHAT